MRLDSDTLSRVDALKDVLSTAWHEATRSDVLRAVIITGLQSMEAEHRVALAKRKPAAADATKATGPKAGAAKRARPKKPRSGG